MSMVGEGRYTISNLQSKCVDKAGASYAHYIFTEIPGGYDYRECFYKLPCIRPAEGVIIKMRTRSGSWEARTGR